MKTIVKSTVTAREFAERIGICEATLKRRVYEQRRGIDNGFPAPLFPAGKKLVWDRQTVEAWIENPSYGNLTPSPDTLRARKKRQEAARRGLLEFGIDVNARRKKP